MSTESTDSATGGARTRKEILQRYVPELASLRIASSHETQHLTLLPRAAENKEQPTGWGCGASSSS